ncbi:MAG: tetraacyldisaccharide 4'-kinase [Alphaproteobacteria bacterium]|nr:tetraacyldisaccharide 4'-kinase [Alphaproteobacteria bacterium]MBU0859608.1 tetraacyldisaccharide 4'-kinase [Alphaproteobacteria bacterium]
MKLKTPAFWYASRGWQSAALIPAAAVYAMGRKLHSRAAPVTPATRMICIGNMVAGGSGKTPAARALMQLVRAHNLATNPMFLTRGYGADESKLLAADAPTITTSNRVQGAADAAARGADLIIMDDGFQNPHIRATINLVVIDGAVGFGNQCLLPAGPLREPLSNGFARADGFILIGEDKHNVRRLLPPEKPVFTARISVAATFTADKSQPYIGFAGLGRPEKFYDTLKSHGLNVVHFVPYPDHHPYRTHDINELVALGRRLGATLITTEKDAMRVPHDFTPLVMPITLTYDDPAALLAFLRGAS